MSILTEYHAHESTFATITHDGGTLTLLIPHGMTMHDGLRQRAAEYQAEADKAQRTANIILSAIGPTP